MVDCVWKGDGSGEIRGFQIGQAKVKGETEVVTLLEIFKQNPEETRHRVRLEIDWYDEAAAEMFALVLR